MKIENFTGIFEFLQQLKSNPLFDFLCFSFDSDILILIQLFPFLEAYLKYYKLGKTKFLMSWAFKKYFKVFNNILPKIFQRGKVWVICSISTYYGDAQYREQLIE